jgi:hypothetical protein
MSNTSHFLTQNNQVIHLGPVVRRSDSAIQPIQPAPLPLKFEYLLLVFCFEENAETTKSFFSKTGGGVKTNCGGLIIEPCSVGITMNLGT